MELLPLLSVLRLTVPFFVIRFPLFGILLSILCDMYDWTFLNVKTDTDYSIYQQWDKSLDLYMFSFAFMISRTWKDSIARRVSLILFVLRACGDLVFLATGLQSVLFFTPNLFETFIIFYLFYQKLSGNVELFRSRVYVIVILSVIAIPKLIHEYLMHVMRKQPWELYSIGDAFNTEGIIKTYVDYLSWGLIFHCLQIVTLMYLVIRQKQRSARR